MSVTRAVLLKTAGQASLQAHCEGVDSASVAVTAAAAPLPVGDHPFLPIVGRRYYGAMYARLFESPFNGPLLKTATQEIAGAGYQNWGEWSHEPVIPVPSVVVDNTGLVSPGHAIERIFAIGEHVGGSAGYINMGFSQNLGQWDREFCELYIDYWMKIVEPTFEQNSVGTKLGGYIGYAERGIVPCYQMIVGCDGHQVAGQYQMMSQMPIAVSQQNNVNRRFGTPARKFVCGRWNRLIFSLVVNTMTSLRYGANQSIKYDDGFFDMWLDNGDGQGLVQIYNLRDVAYRTPAAWSSNGREATSGFYGYHWDAVFGGIDNAAPGRSTENHLRIDHMFMAGIPM